MSASAHHWHYRGCFNRLIQRPPLLNNCMLTIMDQKKQSMSQVTNAEANQASREFAPRH